LNVLLSGALRQAFSLRQEMGVPSSRGLAPGWYERRRWRLFKTDHSLQDFAIRISFGFRDSSFGFLSSLVIPLTPPSPGKTAAPPPTAWSIASPFHRRAGVPVPSKSHHLNCPCTPAGTICRPGFAPKRRTHRRGNPDSPR